MCVINKSFVKETVKIFELLNFQNKTPCYKIISNEVQ